MSKKELQQDLDLAKAQLFLLRCLLADIAPSWLPEGIRKRRRELLQVTDYSFEKQRNKQ